MSNPYKAPESNVDSKANPDGSKKLVTISPIYIINLGLLIGYILSSYMDKLTPELLPDFAENHPIAEHYTNLFLPAFLAGIVLWLVRSRIKITATPGSLIWLTLGNTLLLLAMFSFSNIRNQMLENGTEGSGIFLMITIQILSFLPMVFIGIGFYILLNKPWKIIFQKK